MPRFACNFLCPVISCRTWHRFLSCNCRLDNNGNQLDELLNDKFCKYEVIYEISDKIPQVRQCNINIPARLERLIDGIESASRTCERLIFIDLPTTRFCRIPGSTLPRVGCYDFAQFLFAFFTNHFHYLDVGLVDCSFVFILIECFRVC